MSKTRRKGAVGALMDEYERAALELKLVVEQTPDNKFIHVVDAQTTDESCRSIQTIMSHVVRAGYGYANYVRASFSIASTPASTELLPRQEAVVGLDAMLGYTVQTLDGKWEMTDEEIEAVEIHSSWGVDYTLEQLLEHAIVHILRHRRQIEGFLGSEEMSAPSSV